MNTLLMTSGNLFTLLYLFLPFLFSCQPSDCRDSPDVSGIEVNSPFVRWDEALFEAQSKQDIENLLQQYPDFTQKYLSRSQYPHDSVLVNELYRLIHNPSIDSLYQQVQQTFGDAEDLQSEFTEAFQHLKYYYSDFTPPPVFVTFSGLGTLGNDLLVSDSLIVVSLEFFLGSTARYRPQAYDYQLHRYQPQFIVPSCMLLYSNRFNRTDAEDQTLLAEMVYYGKSYYFVSQILPCVPDSTIIEAMRLQWSRLKQVVEPSGAVSFAALLEHPERFRGRRVGVLISGGNVDLASACALFASQKDA